MIAFLNLDTWLYRVFEEDGVEISSGEAQKIATGRILYKNAPFIVPDEPTDALNPVAEAEVYAGFDALIENRMAIYISHRLSSCRFCDTFAVFDAGQVVQSAPTKHWWRLQTANTRNWLPAGWSPLPAVRGDRHILLSGTCHQQPG